MSTPKTQTESTEAFASVDPEQLATVAGGTSRVSSRSSGDDQLTAMLTEIGSSIKDLAAAKNNNSGGDTMQLMMMMLMMGGMGGGGGAVAAPAAVAPPVINLDTAVSGGGGCRRGKKGW
jgi:hypothetical protein